jgi:DNA-binding NtrC family response regulator
MDTFGATLSAPQTSVAVDIGGSQFSFGKDGGLHDACARFESVCITAALRACGGSTTQARAILKMEYVIFNQKCHFHGINPALYSTCAAVTAAPLEAVPAAE